MASKNKKSFRRKRKNRAFESKSDHLASYIGSAVKVTSGPYMGYEGVVAFVDVPNKVLHINCEFSKHNNGWITARSEDVVCYT